MARLLNTDQGPNCSLKQGNMQLWQLITTSYMAAASSQCFTRLLAISLSHNYCELRILITDHCFFQTESCLDDGEQELPCCAITTAAGSHWGKCWVDWQGWQLHHTTPVLGTALHWTGHDTL